MVSSKMLAVALALCVATAAAIDTTSVTLSSATFKVLETSEAGQGWRSIGAANPASTIKVTIAPKRVRVNDVLAFADMVSDPSSTMYTNYKTTAQLASATLPADDSMAALALWLDDVPHSVNPITRVITATLTVEQATGLFATTFRELRHDTTGQRAIVGDAVNVPMFVATHIEAVFGVHGLPLPPRVNLKTPTAPEGVAVTPAVITSVYNVSGVKPTGSTDNIQAVLEFQGQLLSQSDLTQFFKQFVPTAPAGDDKVYKYVGDSQQGEGVEANLDIQYIMGVAPGVKTEAWQYAGMDFCTDLKQWTQQAISSTSHPNVFSVSYGYQGTLSSLGCSTSQITSIDNDFGTMAAAGITIIFASGDSGSGYTSFFGYDAELYSSWPASSVHVTAVGATTFLDATPSANQRAVTGFGSGGGFSRIVKPAPSFQTAAIAKFYTEEPVAKLPNASIYGKGGRGTPDVAALGWQFSVVVSGAVQSVGGTSAAAPTFSGIVSLLNEARIQQGKKPLGNLNKWLYANPSMLHDVTVGNDRVSRQGLPVPDGFDCEVGWDPVTGWGVPNFPALLKAALAA